MSQDNNVSVDRYLESNFSNNKPTPITYTGYKYERISTQSGNPSNWQYGSELKYVCPEYSDSVWDPEDAQLHVRARIVVDTLMGVGGGADTAFQYPLSQFSTCAIEKYFLSSLLEDLQVRYGGVSTKSLEAPNEQFPLLHAIYTLLSNKNSHNMGTAHDRSCAGVVSTEKENLQWEAPKRTKAATSLDAYNPFGGRVFDILNDADQPFNICLDGDQRRRIEPDVNNYLPSSWYVQISSSTLGTIANARDATIRFNSTWSSGHFYRTALIISRATSFDASPLAASTAPPSTYVEAYDVNFVVQLYHPLLCQGYKLPANIPLEITLRRSRTDNGSFIGDPRTDALIADKRALPTGNSVGQQLAIVKQSKYVVQYQNVELYMKRLFLARDAWDVYKEASLLSYDLPKWTSQIINLNNNEVVNQNLTFAKQPGLVLIGLIPKTNYLIPQTDQNEKYISRFDTVSSDVAYISNIFINTSYGQIPEEEYESDPSGSGLNPQDVRAYHDFKKCFMTSDSAISFQTWKNSTRYYAFLINSDQANPHYEVPRESRSNINVRARVQIISNNLKKPENPEESKPNLDDYALHVVGMEWNKLLVTNLKNVSIAV